MTVGESLPRLDATAKVTGRARFSADLTLPGTRVAKYLRSTIAHGRVTHIDCSEARQLTGVDAIFTYADVPKTTFATAGHAFSLDPAGRDPEDRQLLTDYVRYHGDEIAIVVAENALIAQQALALIKVEYETYPPLLSAEKALADGARELHPHSGNRVGAHEYHCGDLAHGQRLANHKTHGHYQTQMVQHCHLENHVAWAYVDDLDHIVIVSSTQIPHICRRIVAQALDLPMTRIRVIKPAVGGGFGNKQDVVLEPMVAFLATKLAGVPVCLELSREESLIGTRIRHPMAIDVKAGAKDDGTLTALEVKVSSNTGGYASHGHAIAKAAGSKLAPLYPRAALHYDAETHYSNLPTAGAMRGYGAPQVMFAVESTMEDMARTLKMDSIAFRLQNCARPGDLNPLSGKPIGSCGLAECLEKGRELIQWEHKKARYAKQSGKDKRYGLGVACFSYGSGTYPANVEIAGARMILVQDGTVQLQIGATEIGQGSDTVFAQMAAERLGVPADRVQVISAQDTDVTPFDPGSFASRQTYVASPAVAATADELRQRILAHASVMTEYSPAQLTLKQGSIYRVDEPDTPLLCLKELALDAYYHKTRGQQLTAECSRKVTHNAYAYGCTLVAIEVDIPLCRINIEEIWNVHDAGRIINPQLAAGQVHGGVGMGIAGALSEELLVNPENGKIYNNNLLDYKIPTMADLPDIGAAFVETEEPNAPFGNKSLGEPPLLSIAPALRNALLDATGVTLNQLPLSPKALYRAFNHAGLL